MAFADLVAATDRAVQGHLGGVTVTYQPQYEDPVEIEGVFDTQYLLVDPAQPGVEQLATVLFVRAADLPLHPDDDEPTITVGETDYRIAERMPDGMGGMRLRLHQVQD